MGHVYISADTRLRIHDLIKHTEGMTQAKLAKELGISESTLSRFLSGQTTKMGNDRIIKIANIFNVSTDFLLGETNVPVKKNYDISELGLSAEAAQALYTHKVNTEIVCQLLESTKFAALTNLLANYQKEVFATGMAATRETLEQFRKNLTKGQDNIDLRTLTPEDITSAVLMMVPEGALPEKELIQLGDAFTVLLTVSGNKHDE